MRHPIAIAVLAAALSSTAASAETPEERGLLLTKKSDAANSGFVGERSQIELVLINAHGDRTTRKMRMQVQEVPSDGDKSLSEFDWPADVKGTKMLTWTHKTGDDDQWLYMPAIKRIKRISSRDRTGSFMGSEFAYEDLGSQEVEKYSYKFMRDDTLNGRAAWMIERVPTGKSGYARQVVWMDQEYLNPLRLEYYDRKNELLKTAEFKAYQRQGQFWRVGEIHMTNQQTRKQSVLTWKSRSLGVKITSRTFESASLEE
ncbi:MAG: outer membrane lipoprotein-sorting protein [Bdellovibrionales bacterium]|nr:outer membrane lipoprotein-sorting protein [Bdellovibrionales bacterium]